MQFRLNCGELAHLPLFLANQKAVSLSEVEETVNDNIRPTNQCQLAIMTTRHSDKWPYP